MVLNEGLWKIGVSAFSGCTSLQHVTLPSGMHEIGECAFYGCTKLRKVVLNEGLWEIKSQAFNSCTSLESVTIPFTVHDMGYLVFMHCTNLKEVLFQEGMKKINEKSIDYMWSSLEQIDSKICKRIKHNAFAPAHHWGASSSHGFQLVWSISSRLVTQSLRRRSIKSVA